MTGATNTIASAWIEQLKMGGMILGNFATELGTATPMYRLIKQEDGSANGNFLSVSSSFMNLSEKNPQPSRESIDTLEVLPIVEQGSTHVNIANLLHNPAFALFVA